jgi:pyridoxal phosphate enzyme (YggS family)
MPDIAANLAGVRKSIAECEQKFGLKPHSVRLLGATKKQPVEKILEAINAGLFVFGENYLQEALSKMSDISELAPGKNIEWHYIGPIQTNKTRKIAEHFAWVQSVSSIKIADRLNEQRPPHLPPLNICVEVNVDAEATKSGVSLADAGALVKYCQALPHLKVRGLMAIPQIQSDFDAQRREFHKLYEVWQELRNQGLALDTLSMGMTEDFEAAIAEKSTMVRIGTGIFGPRRVD